jgi:hypothetical protein
MSAIKLKATMPQYREPLTANGQARNTYEAVIPHDTALDTLLTPNYWWPVSRQMKPLEDICCLWEDGSRVVVLKVMGKNERAQTILTTAVSDWQAPKPELPAGFSLEFNRNKSIGWHILQEGRNAAYGSGFATAMEAAAWFHADTRSEDTPAARAAPKAKEPPKGAKLTADKPEAA